MNCVVIGDYAINLENIADVAYVRDYASEEFPDATRSLLIRFLSGTSTDVLHRELLNEEADQLWVCIRNLSQAPTNTVG
jgi:hypothetical protein